MNYYKRHIGDYARSTMHLTVLEHGVYTLLLDRYYDTEQPFTMDQARRFVRAGTENGVGEALQNVLSEFFERTEDGLYRSRRIERELADAATRADSARTNGQRGGRPRKTPRKPEKEAPAPKAAPAAEPPGLQVAPEVKTNPPIHESTNPSNPPQPPAGEDAGDGSEDESGGGGDQGGGDTGEKPVPSMKYTAAFLRWWECYPSARRHAKPKCFLIWKREKLADFVDTLVEDVKTRLEHDHKWRRDGGQFIPNTQTYLNQQRWNDGMEDIPAGPAKGARSATEADNDRNGQQWAGNDGSGFNVE